MPLFCPAGTKSVTPPDASPSTPPAISSSCSSLSSAQLSSALPCSSIVSAPLSVSIAINRYAGARPTVPITNGTKRSDLNISHLTQGWKHNLRSTVEPFSKRETEKLVASYQCVGQAKQHLTQDWERRQPWQKTSSERTARMGLGSATRVSTPSREVTCSTMTTETWWRPSREPR